MLVLSLSEKKKPSQDPALAPKLLPLFQVHFNLLLGSAQIPSQALVLINISQSTKSVLLPPALICCMG